MAALKEAVGLTGSASDTVDDGVLLSVIFRASAYVDEYLDAIRPGYVGFASQSNSRTAVGSSTRVYDGTGTDTLFIDDAQSISGVSDYTVTISSNSWRLWPYNSVPKRALIYALPATSTQGLILTHWMIGTANIGVTGYFGLDHVPNDIEQITISVAVVLWRRYQSGDQTAATEVVSPKGGGGPIILDPEIRGILSQLDYGWGVPGVWGA